MKNQQRLYELDGNYMITEEITGYYYYHISLKANFTVALCNKQITMMHTSIPLSTWGEVGHLKERYCKKCEDIFNGRNNNG